MADIAVVTGGAGAIGSETVYMLADKGFDVIGVDSVAPKGQRPGDHVVGDVSDPQTWQEVKRIIEGRDQLVGAVVHTAYTLDRAPLMGMTPESWATQIAVNLSSVQLLFHTLGFDLMAHPVRVVFVSSVHSRIGVPGHSAYAASKGALNALTRQLAVEWGPSARVNSIVLGPVMTPVWDGATEEDFKQIHEAIALGRMGTPRDVANLVDFLTGEGSDFLTGSTIVADGGFLAVKETR